jgi:hypothetical protein
VATDERARVAMGSVQARKGFRMLLDCSRLEAARSLSDTYLGHHVEQSLLPKLARIRGTGWGFPRVIRQVLDRV